MAAIQQINESNIRFHDENAKLTFFGEPFNGLAYKKTNIKDIDQKIVWFINRWSKTPKICQKLQQY